MAGICNFGNQNRRSGRPAGRGTSNEQSPEYKHDLVVGSGRQNNAQGEPDIAKSDGLPASKVVVAPGNGREADGSTERLHSDDETKIGTSRIAHKVAPFRESLEAVHHGTIVSVGGREEDEAENGEVEADEMGFLVPGESILGEDCG